MLNSSRCKLYAFTFLLSTLSGCSSIQASSQKSSLSINVSGKTTGIVKQQMLGVNSRWLDSGGTIIQYGEMVRDRSFRNHDKPGYRWLNSANADTGGKIKYLKKGGDPEPWGGKGYPGAVELSQKKVGYTCVSQPVLGEVTRGEKYELHVSAKLEEGKTGMSVFLADGGFMPIEEVDNLSWIEEEWNDYSFTLEPTKAVDNALLRICIVTPGAIAVDEVRMANKGKAPRIRPIAKKRIKELGVQSMRWPTGSDADYFDWKSSVGSVRFRGENLSAFGDPQTPTWGLHEFLDFTESENILPLITVNIRQSPKRAAELIEYVLGSSSTPMGKLRSKNGRTKPWKVVHFELGNEPVEAYKDTFSMDDTSKGYVKLSRAVAREMKKKAKKLGKKIDLKGVLETTFSEADWIGVVPMLSKWNPNVLDKKTGLLPELTNIKGNFYSAFTWKWSDKELFKEVMGGGTTLTRSIDRLNKKHEKLPPFWVTEYGIMVQKSNPTQIMLERAKDYQAGLAVADILISSFNAGFGGAYAFNLAEEGTWGMLANNTDYRLRPSGLAFSMISKLSGTELLPVKLGGVADISISGGKGNNPSGMKYPSMAAMAGKDNNGLQLIVLNRSYDVDTELTVNLKGSTAKTAKIHQLGPYEPKASNDKKAGKVVIKARALKGMGNSHVLKVPARTLMRVVYK